MIEQTSIFDLMHPEYRIDKPIRLIELFGGIGAQSRALEIIGKPFESHRVVEWAAPSIIAYNAIHVRDFADHTEGLSFDEVLNRLNGVSLDYNKPATREQLKKRGEQWCRKVLSSMVAIKDHCPDVSRVKAKDLEIRERERYCYVMTYSFPCQDLSNAGKMAGMEKGSGTRSGLLWEVERILNECKAEDCLPQVLLMENVPGVMGNQNMKPWGEWLNALRDLGYSNKFRILNAKGFGIPQNRERAFMVSVLGDWAIPFPREFLLRHPLKDFLDGNVDESYFLSAKMMEGFNIGNQKQADKGNGFRFNVKDIDNPNEVAFTIATKEGSRRTDNYLCIPCATKKGYMETEEGDGVIPSWKGARGVVQKKSIPTLLTNDSTVGVVVNKEDCLWVRKLTEYECGKLMGFDRADFKRMSEAGLSKSALYHCAGDSIVVNVLIAIFGALLGIDCESICERRADELAGQKG